MDTDQEFEELMAGKGGQMTAFDTGIIMDMKDQNDIDVTKWHKEDENKERKVRIKQKEEKIKELKKMIL